MEKARKLAAGEFSENIVLSGAADQYQMIQNAGDAVRSYIGHQSEIIELDSIEDVGSRLGEYVGSTGKYTAVTNNVEIGFPFETLKDITVVDTPGFDDPVPSRDAQARNALKKCDVIFAMMPKVAPFFLLLLLVYFLCLNTAKVVHLFAYQKE